jgi:release factor glutamine methyltransferase
MTVESWMREATKLLAEAGIGTARLDALVLLEDISEVSRARLLAEPGFGLAPGQVADLQKLLSRRVLHEPLAYVRGKTEFYGREFVVTSDVLEPRPESETMIDLLKVLTGIPKKPRIADIGTGSGALGITAKLELQEASVELLDIDEAALQIAKRNVDLFTLDISVIHSDLLKDSTDNYDVLLCNLPYVPDDFQINTAATHEPRIAIFGGPDGLDLYRKLFQQLQNSTHKVLYILCESLPMQHKQLQQIASGTGYDMSDEQDFIQVFKYSAS